MAVLRRSDLVSTITFIIQYIGLWRREERSSQHALAKAAIFCYLSSYTFQLFGMVLAKGDTNRLFECFSVISFCGMGILKLFSLSRRRQLWLNVLDRMARLEVGQLRRHEDSDTEYDSDNGQDCAHVRSYIANYTGKFQRTSSMLFRIYCSTGVLFILSPFIEYAFWLLRGVESEDYPHILPSWNPLDGISFSLYVLIVICETVAAIYCVCVHIAFDSTVIGVMIFICGQFSSLFYQCEMIGGKGNICNLSKKRNERAHFRIIKCHRVHVELVNTVNELDSLIKNILGFYFFLATLTLCSVAVRLKSEQMSTMQLVSLLQYMCATLIQLYIYCSYGDAVLNGSAINAGQGPFAAAIWCLSPKIRREIAILGMGMLKPRRLHAGPLNTLDLPSFIQIVRAAYSYYAVLGNSKQN